MNKSELSKEIVKETKLSQKDAESALSATLSAINKGAKKDKVQLVGFGTFKTKKRKARTGRNPRTGEPIKIKAKTVMTFSASKNPKY